MNYREWKIVGITSTLIVSAIALILAGKPDPAFFQNNFIAELYSASQSHPVPINLISNVPGQKPFVLIIQRTTGISWSSILFLPVGMVFRPVAYFILVYSFTRRPVLGCVASVLSVMRLGPYWGLNTFWVHSLGYVAFLLLLWFIYRWGEFNHQRQIILGLSIISVFYLFDYTGHFWALTFLGFIFFTNITSKYLRGGSVSKKLGGLFFITTVIYWVKRTPFSALGSFSLGEPLKPIMQYFGLAPTNGAISPYFFDGSAGGAPRLTLVFYGVVVMITTIYSFVLIQRIVVRRGYSSGDIIWFGLGLTTATGIAIYTLLGRFTQSFVFLISPFLALVGLNGINRYTSAINGRALTVAALVILLLTATVPFISSTLSGDVYTTSGANTAPSADWFFSHTDRSTTILTDRTTRGRYRLPEEKAGATVNYQDYTLQLYKTLVEGNSIGSSYIVIDYQADSTPTIWWRSFQPLRIYERQVNTNEDITRVYDDGDISIYQSTP